VLSANDKIALEAQMKNLGIYLEQRPEIFQNDLMSNLAYTLGQRRSLMQWRVAISSPSSFDLVQALNSGKISPSRETETPRIGFIFTGQGAQWNAMGRELYEHYPVFTATMDTCDRYLDSIGAPFSLIAELKKDAEISLVNEAHISQPACTAIQLALTDLLRSWNILPTAVAGHSSGEIGAAYAAGILRLDSCMAISYYRGMATIKLRKKFPELKGAMMAVGCTKEEIAPIILDLSAKEVRIACFNSPTSLTISGDEPAIDELQALLEQNHVFNRKLQVDVAYHSHHMKLVADDYEDSLRLLDPPKSTPVKFHSSLFGHLVKGTRLKPSYWVDNLTQSVRFSEALTSMCEPVDGNKTGVNMIIEIGPHSALAGPVKQIFKACGPQTMKIPYASALIRKRDAVETALELASTLFIKGATLNLGAINLPTPTKSPMLLIDIPRYPWNHQTRYWHENRFTKTHKNRTTPRNDLLGTLANYSNDLEPTWRNILRIDDLPWLRHHKIQSLTLFPMSGFVAMAVEAASQRAASRNIQFDNFELRDVSVSKPLMVTDEDIEMTLQLRPHQDGTFGSSDTWDEFKIHSWGANKGWTEHCKGIITVKGKNHDDVDGGRLSKDSVALLQSTIAEITSTATASVDKTKMYDSLSELGVSYGPSFQGVDGCQANDSSSMASITASNTSEEMPQGFQTSMIVQPAFLEQLIEMYWPILGAGRTSIQTIYLPSSIGRLTIYRQITELTKKPGDSLKAFCQGTLPTSHPKPSQMSMFATTGADSNEALIRLDDLTISPIIERDMTSEGESHRELCYRLDWEPILEPLVLPLSNCVSNGTSNGLNGHAELSNPVTNGTSNGISSEISSAPNGVSDLPAGAVVIIHGDSESQSLFASKLADQLEDLTGSRPDTGKLGDIKADKKLCLIISELETPLLSSLTAAQFKSLQGVLAAVQGVLWVVRGAYINSSNPDTNMITGLSRSIRSETLLKFSTLDLDSDHILSQEHTVKAIVQVFKATFGLKAEPNCELEFVERDGKFLTPRIINDAEMNEYVHKQTKASALEPTPFALEGRPLQMAIGSPGALETLHFVDQSLDSPLPDSEIEIEVKAIGMNPRDITAAMGQLGSLNIGLECSGIVTKVGVNVTKFAIGDHVTGISIVQGVFSTYARIKAEFAFKIKNEMSFEAAASIPIDYCTAHYGLIDLGRLLKDERVLIHGATSATGQAAICLAQMIGAEVFTSVGNSESRELLKTVYGLCEDHIFLSQKASFGAALGGVAANSRFDVVLNCISADIDTLRDIWDTLDNFGRFIELGKQDSRAILEDNKSFMSVDLISLAEHRPKIMTRLLSDVSELLKNAKIRPVGITVFPISDVEKAFKVLQSGNVDGKLVISPQPGNEVKVSVHCYSRE
jgi:NADPH:quinone reductase-like Zn-dependent oxidoreductase/malonyl CoA-acyl carrier protein transacylase